MSLASINGTPIARAFVQLPSWGLWWADVDPCEAVTIAIRSAVTITLADKTLVGTVISGGAVDGKASYRIVGGAGGWGNTVPAKGYADDGGVRRVKVLTDVASACGETIESPPNTRMGIGYARVAGPGTVTLNAVTPRAWYVDLDGVTRFGARTTQAYTGTGARTRIDPRGAIWEIEADELKNLIPGVTIDGGAPATDVEWHLSESKLYARVYAGATYSRRMAAYRRIVEAIFPEIRYAGKFEYRVVRQDGERLNLQPARVASGMPDLLRVPVRPGVAGMRADVKPGSLVLVEFVDRDPSRPAVTSHDAYDAPGLIGIPTSLQMGGPVALPLARTTDAVQAGPFAGAIVGGSTLSKSA